MGWILLLLLLLAAPARAQGADAAPPQPDDGVYRWPLWLDATHEWRVQSGSGWNNTELHLSAGFDELMGRRDRQLHSHRMLWAARFDAGYGHRTAGRRVAVLAGYVFGLDDGAESSGGDFPNLAREGFPFQRSSMASVVVGLGTGWMHSRGTQGSQGGAVQSQDTLRLEQFSYFSLFGFGFRQSAALNINLRDGPAREWEAGAWLVLGRPLLPFSLAVGYSYQATELAGGGGFSLRAGIHF